MSAIAQRPFDGRKTYNNAVRFCTPAISLAAREGRAYVRISPDRRAQHARHKAEVKKFASVSAK